MQAALGTVLSGLLSFGVAFGCACSDAPSGSSGSSGPSDLPRASDAALAGVADSGAGAPRDPGRTSASSHDAASARVDAASAHVDAAAARVDDAAGPSAPVARSLPTPNAALDYQLGGAYAPPDQVAIVVRDRREQPAPGLYNICYVNAFQSQSEDESFWLTEHAALVLRDEAGQPVIDPDWDELLLDIRTPESRAGLLAIVGPWIEGCARAGFAAVEIDNLDSYARSGKRLTQAQAVLFMRLLAATAHAAGLAIAQKNAAELLARRAELDTDFAVVEECYRYDECGDFAEVYGDSVLVIEYRRADFDKGCQAFPELSIVLRDLELVTPSSRAYVYAGC